MKHLFRLLVFCLVFVAGHPERCFAADYYQILGVARNASDDEIKKAYRKAGMKYHPDRIAAKAKEQGLSPEQAKLAWDKDEESFKAAKEAYEMLSNPVTRAEYDQYGAVGVHSNNPNPAHPSSNGTPEYENIFVKTLRKSPEERDDQWRKTFFVRGEFNFDPFYYLFIENGMRVTDVYQVLKEAFAVKPVKDPAAEMKLFKRLIKKENTGMVRNFDSRKLVEYNRRLIYVLSQIDTEPAYQLLENIQTRTLSFPAGKRSYGQYLKNVMAEMKTRHPEYRSGYSAVGRVVVCVLRSIRSVTP
jgi:hypothetical protein